VSLVTTVADRKQQYSARDVKKAEEARRLQSIIGRPDTATFLQMIRRNEIPNCTVSADDIIAAEQIFGPDLGSLKGKTTRRAPTVVDTSLNPLPHSVLSRYGDVTLGIDIMHVNGLPFLVTISHHLKFGTIEYLVKASDPVLLRGLAAVFAVYSKRGFSVRMIRGDGRFESLRGGLTELGVDLNVVSENEHVPEIERYIRTVKERMRCVQ